MKKLFKKTLSIIIAAVICVSCLCVTGFAADEKLTFKVKDGTAYLAKCDASAEGTVVVPSVVKIKNKSYDVTSIGESAFEDCDKVTAISISEGIISIGSRAFANCDKLTDVYVPQSLSICQYTAFTGCGTVTVHCYSSNYQFFTVYGLSENVNVDIVDGEDSQSSGSGLTGTIINLIKKILLAILSIFTGGSNK